MPILNFLRYNNAVPVALSLILVGGASTFAATNPQAVYSETKTVLSVDNTYLVGKDLASYSPRTQIDNVTEDADNYYVAYKLYTIDLEDSVWKDVVKNQTMKVSKMLLGQYRDLGVYVTQQLKENIDQENRRLRETQEIEKKVVSQKVVATAYGGLIGKMLDETMETLPGYTPVVTPPPAPETQVASAGASDSNSSQSSTNTPSESQPQQPANPQGAPTLEVLGGNPAELQKGQTYIDLGAAITGPTDADRALGIKVYVNGNEVPAPSIDTSAAGEWTITYKATNQQGLTGSAQRIVRVTDPYAVPVPAESSSTSTPPTESSTTTQE